MGHRLLQSEPEIQHPRKPSESQFGVVINDQVAIN